MLLATVRKKSFEKRKRSFLRLGNEHNISLVFFYRNVKNKEKGRKREKKNEEEEEEKKKNY
jgi:hypothetical protein